MPVDYHRFRYLRLLSDKLLVMQKGDEAIASVNEAAESVATETKVAAEEALAGAEISVQTAGGMSQVRAATEELAGSVRDLGERSAAINVIVETIEDIAGQTNLLALNAAIEAARAGEHGKGFAVVADEVRKLAERSADATKEISAMIRAVQAGADTAVAAMKQAGSDVTTAVELTDKTGEAFDKISKGTQASAARVDAILESISGLKGTMKQVAQALMDAATTAERNQGAAEAMAKTSEVVVGSLDNVSAVVKENTASTEEMAVSSGEVTEAIDSIATISQENSAAAEELSASADEMSAQVSDVETSAERMRTMASDLQEAVAQFTLVANGASGGTNGKKPEAELQLPPDEHSSTVANGNGHSIEDLPLAAEADIQ